MLFEAQPRVMAKEARVREMTWTTAERTRRGQPRGKGRGGWRATSDFGASGRNLRLSGREAV